MNKQFSPFLQRYFLNITEIICNQVRKYPGIFYHLKFFLDGEQIGTVCFNDALLNLDGIEPRVRELVQALNHSGQYKTLASCQGHLTWLPWPQLKHGKTPYIFFRASAELYEIVWNKFAPDQEPQFSTYLTWYPELSFYPEAPYGLVMLLRARPRYWWTSRTNIDRDLALLKNVMVQINKNVWK